MVVIDFQVETSDELDVMLLCEETAILGIVAAVEVIIPPGEAQAGGVLPASAAD